MAQLKPKADSWLNTPIQSRLGTLSLAGELENNLGIDAQSMRILGKYALILILDGLGFYEDDRGVCGYSTWECDPCVSRNCACLWPAQKRLLEACLHRLRRPPIRSSATDKRSQFGTAHLAPSAGRLLETAAKGTGSKRAGSQPAFFSKNHRPIFLPAG